MGQAEAESSISKITADRRASDTDTPVVDPQPSRTARSLQVRENLDQLMRQIEHARHDADQMMEEMAALEVDAGQVATLKRENDVLREKLDTSNRETIAEASKAEGAGREIARLKDELERIRQDYEKSQREASANALDAERIEDRLRATVAAFGEAKRDLETLREAKDKVEVDAACLRANLAERDRAQSALMQTEAELRMQTAKLQTRYEEVTDALARKERSVLEKSAELASSKDRIADLEAEAVAARDELRILSNKYSDLKVSQDARIYSLNDGLEQERESHRMTRKLLEEERAKSDDLIDEIASLKEQATISGNDTQKMKRELNATRTQVHEYGDKLKEAHLHYAAAQSDIQRLESALEDAKKDSISLSRQANKSEQLLRENTDLHDKVASLQQRVDRYRGSDLLDDVPIMLSSASHSPNRSTVKDKASTVATSTPNVARIRRR
jgi:chromosome segregation ATPase